MGNGDIYQGDTNEIGLPHGSGVMRYKNGDRFTGKFDNGVQVEGEILLSAMNESYVG